MLATGKMEIKIVKGALSILFLGCLFHLPYGYYQMVRFLGFLGFALLAYFSFKQKEGARMIVYIALALLFQPFIKIALGRAIWNIVDVILAVVLIISLFWEPSKVNKIEKGN